MRLGLSSALKHSSSEEWAKKHHDLGLGAVVFPLDYRADEKQIEAYVAAAKAYDLTIAEVGVWNNVLSEEEDKQQEAIAYAICQLQLADAIGAKCCVNIAGTRKAARWDGPHQDNFSAAAWEQTVKTVQYIVDHAKPQQTKYAIEPMPWMIPTGPEEYLELLDDIDRSAVGVHLDLVNMINCPQRYFFQEAFMDQCFHLLKEKICSCHLKDIQLQEDYTFQLKETACGKGHLNIEHYIALAEKEQREMPLIIEHLSSDEEYINVLKYVQKRLGLLS